MRQACMMGAAMAFAEDVSRSNNKPTTYNYKPNYIDECCYTKKWYDKATAVELTTMILIPVLAIIGVIFGCTLSTPVVAMVSGTVGLFAFFIPWVRISKRSSVVVDKKKLKKTLVKMAVDTGDTQTVKNILNLEWDYK